MGSSGKILVVDDTPSNLEVITETLSSVGYIVATAISGERALKRLQNYLPDLILLDVQMPGIDGFATCQQIKANPDTTKIPIIFITAFSDTQSVVKGFSVGAVDYISKPFQEPELLARVKTHLQLHLLSQSLEKQVNERTIELHNTIEKLHHSQVQLVQHEKMSALGNLVAGVAHEMNNPLGFIYATLQQTRPGIADVKKHMELYQKSFPNPNQEIIKHAESIDLDYTLEDLPQMIDSMVIACDRLTNISTSLRTFSRADQDDKVQFYIHEGIDSTILILQHRLKANDLRPSIEVVTDYGIFPKIDCFPGQLNQVFMNILANAIDALDDSSRGLSFAEIQANPNRIIIKIVVENSNVNISIADNGKGMSEEVQHKIFDHLFTTKGVGKGTGLGLAIAKQIIEDNHGGTLEVESEIGLGSQFFIRLPIIHSQS